jgi:hypothetical protein
MDRRDMGRGKVITYKRGGSVRRYDDGGSVTGDDKIYYPAPDPTNDPIYTSEEKGVPKQFRGQTWKSRGGAVSHGKRLVSFYAKGGAVEHPRKQPKGSGGFGYGAHGKGQGGFEDRGSSKHMSGGLEPPIKRGSGGLEAPRHPKKGTGEKGIYSRSGPMGPNFHAGGGGGTARMKKAARAAAFVNKAP